MIYLDHNASAPLSDAARARIGELLAMGPGNPSSVHLPGQRARAVIEDARDALAAAVGAHPDEVVFTSGATEANHLAWQGAARAWRAAAEQGEVRSPLAWCTAIEHPSVLAAAAQTPWTARQLPVTADGRLDGRWSTALDEGAAMVSVMLANNETGVLLPVAAIAQKAREIGAIMHSDATQALGRVPVDFAALGVDLLSLSGHKIGALPGVGALIVGRGTDIAPLTPGHQEGGVRGGTENVLGIASLGAAAEALGDRLADIGRQRRLRDVLRDRLRRLNGAQVHAEVAAAQETGNVLNIAFTGVSGARLVMALDVEGLAVSSGAACASGTVTASRVLAAMPGANAQGAIRLSLGPETTTAEIAQAGAIVENVVARLRAAMY